MDPRALRQLRAAHERQDDEIRRLITEAVNAGIRSQDIAEALGISRSTLWRHYANELRQREDGGRSTATTDRATVRPRAKRLREADPSP